MGLWSVAKKYLNSTIGTSYAKSLDKIIEELNSSILLNTENVRLKAGTTATLGSINVIGNSSSYYYTVLFKGIAPITGLYTINGSSRRDKGTIYKVKREKSSYYYNEYAVDDYFKTESIDNIADKVFYQTASNLNETFYMYAQAGEPIILLIDYGNVGLQNGSIKYKA